MRNLYLFILVLITCSFSDPYTIKRISDKDFRYEFYTTKKTIKPKTNKTYYWFKGGQIHNAQAGVVGDLLDGDFTKMYHSNRLAEQGVFKTGLKTGLWKSWHENGKIATTQYWNNGLRTGLFNSFDSNGKLIEKGNYHKDLKNGLWVNYTTKDTLYYKKGIIKPKKIKLSKEEKKQLKEDLKKQKETKKQQKAERSKVKKANTKTDDLSKPKKDNFFKRLFSKKEKNSENNGKSA